MHRGAIPVLVRGRKGQRSIADSLAKALTPSSRRTTEWPALTFGELATLVSEDQGYEVRASTIRSTIYGHAELFESNRVDGKVVWRLTAEARKLIGR